MSWHPKGDALAIIVPCYKTKKKEKRGGGAAGERYIPVGREDNLEIAFTKHKKRIPITQLKTGEEILHFAWEPTGPRFGVIKGDSNSPDVVFYKIDHENNTINHLFELKKRSAIQLSWNPFGRYLVIAGDMLEFCDVNRALENQKLGKSEDEPVRVKHQSMNTLWWSPCGRYFSTAVVMSNFEDRRFAESTDTGYKIWSFQGDELTGFQISQFHQILWRPQPPSLLSDEDREKIMKNFKEYKNKFHAIDSKIIDEGKETNKKKKKK
eukprot:TRINITY_DN570_c0_g1_i1.p1 TRINITY_DN570_c0_g1~~TRINITY_DN570_c0_g1_i1.p1  ORF type:complete len:280 (+),score=88.29 TRINITY_DN570_c0_g1_i1:44-841(+)